MITKWSFRITVILGVLALGGCGGSDLNLAPVKGKVTMNGQPVRAATVSFIPDSSQGTEGPMSAGVLDDQGQFVLKTGSGENGAIIGFHKVTVACPLDPSQGSSPSGQAVPQAGTTPCDVPAKYESYATTDLTAEVTKGSNEINFELTQ